MHKLIYLQSYEVLAVLVLRQQNSDDALMDFLKILSNQLDKEYNCDEFKKIFQNSKSKAFANFLDEERLFIDYSLNELEYSNLNILSLQDRLLIYSSVQGWLLVNNLNTSINLAMQKFLMIADEDANAINHFFFKEHSEKIFGKNEIFTLEPKSIKKDDLEGVWVENHKPKEMEMGSHYFLEKLEDSLKVLFLYKLKIFIVSCSQSNVIISKSGESNYCRWELLGPGEKITINKNLYLDYYSLKNRFLNEKYAEQINLFVSDLSFSYNNGKGIKKFSFNAEPGTFIGVIGKEGSGKTTLLKLLAGEILYHSGDIQINGYGLKKELYHLKGMIGYVPEEDLLFDELTAYENLYFAARLYLGDMPETLLKEKIDLLFDSMDLKHIKDLVVGLRQEKRLQPGQRRLLNISLELLREPQILIVDNALSALNFSDSSKIIQLLSDYSFRGNIVITSITETGFKTHQYFDKILIIDDGGFPIYFGKVDESYEYLKNIVGTKDFIPSSDKIIDSLIQLVNTAKESSNDHKLRLISPAKFYQYYSERKSKTISKQKFKKVLPANILRPPKLDRQYVIFSIRNFKIKLSKGRDIAFILMASPVLALLLSLIMRNSDGNTYNFVSNPNIPEFFFLSTILAIFLGLVQSSNEIYKEKKINKKQEYLNLSRFSYINSKITYLFIISVIQSVTFVLITNSILELKGMYLIHWIVFFSSQAFGIILGLIFSSTHKYIESIYIKSLPIVLVLQLVLGGGFIKMDSLNLQGKRYTSILSDLMVSRWGFEALMVYQFKCNNYERKLYSVERNIAQGAINSNYLIPALKAQLDYCAEHFKLNTDTTELLLRSLRKSLTQLSNNYDIFTYENIDNLNIENINDNLIRDAQDYLEYANLFFYELYDQALQTKSNIIKTLSDSLGENQFDLLKQNYYNYAVAEKVTDSDAKEPMKYISGIPVQISDPIYQFPVSEYGRGQMFVPQKQINAELIDTVEYNLSIIWIMNLLLYILLLSDVLNKWNTF